MAQDIRVNIDVKGEDQAARDLKKVGDAAAKAGNSIEDLGDQSAAAGKQSEKAGEGFKASAEGAGFLDKQIVETTANLKKLVTQLDATGDTSLIKDIRKERRSLRQFESLAKEISAPVAAAGAMAGEGLAKSLAEGFRTGSGALKGAATPVLAALAVSAAPGIGAIVSGAVLGAVGTGGIIGGVALAAQDPRVKAAAEDVGATLGDEFTDAADDFVAPVLRSLGKVANAGWADKLAPSFDKLATKVDPLTDGLIGLADNALVGLQDAIDSAGPSIDVLARELPEIGAALGDFLSDLSENPEAAALALELLMDAIEGALDVGGDLISWLAETYGGFYELFDAIGLVDNRLHGWKKGAEESGEATLGLSAAAAEATANAKALEKAIGELFGRTMGAKEASIQYQQSIDDLMEELTDGTRTLDENTQAGRDNWHAIQNNASAIDDMREANLRNKMPLAEANALYERQFEQLRKTLLNLGYNKKAVNEYIDSLKNIPRNAKTTVWIETKASGALSAILAGVNSVSGARAAGGPVMAGNSYVVGERGPEIVTFGANGMVHNAEQSAAMMSGASGGSSTGGVPEIRITVVGTDALTRAFAESFRFDVRTTANGNAQEYWGTANGG